MSELGRLPDPISHLVSPETVIFLLEFLRLLHTGGCSATSHRGTSQRESPFAEHSLDLILLLSTCRWLQRDFGIYVVNMFDTGQAARVLEFPGKGLKYLLQHFCDVKVNFQLYLPAGLRCRF